MEYFTSQKRIVIRNIANSKIHSQGEENSRINWLELVRWLILFSSILPEG